MLKKARLTIDALHDIEDKDLTEVILVLNKQFLDDTALCLPSQKISSTGQNLILPTTLASDSEEANNIIVSDRPQKLNFTSIAKVCQTNADTAMYIYREIMAQIDEGIRKGQSIRL